MYQSYILLSFYFFQYCTITCTVQHLNPLFKAAVVCSKCYRADIIEGQYLLFKEFLEAPVKYSYLMNWILHIIPFSKGIW